MKKDERVATFSLEGQFVGFIGDYREKPKHIRVATATGECCIKLSKELRYSLPEALEPGAWLEISGIQKYKYKTGELKLKAYQVKVHPQREQRQNENPSPVASHHLHQTPSQEKSTAPTSSSRSDQSPVTTPKTKTCVMVCQKSSCRKRGADAVCQAVTESLRDRGIDDQVTLKGTGCMKECKKGPCVVFMPDKSRYVGVAPKQVPALVEKHFAAKLKPETSKIELSPVT